MNKLNGIRLIALGLSLIVAGLTGCVNDEEVKDNRTSPNGETLVEEILVEDIQIEEIQINYIGD